MSNYARGLLITTIGVLILTPDGTLIRLLATDAWTASVWRGLLTSLTISTYVVLRYRSRLPREFATLGLMGLATIIALGVSNISFVAAINNTDVADVLVIVATTPLFGALWSWLLFKELTPLRTWLAIAAGLVGVLITVEGSFGRGGSYGMGMAVLCVSLLGLGLTLLRQAPQVNNFVVVACSTAFAGFVALPFAGDLALEGTPLVAALILGLFVVPVSTALITIGPRYLPSAEVGLLMLLETVIGPIWVWKILSEAPSQETLLGGAIIVATLVVHTIVALGSAARRRRRRRPAAAE